MALTAAGESRYNKHISSHSEGGAPMDYKEGCKRMIDKINQEWILKRLYNLIAIYYAKA